MFIIILISVLIVIIFSYVFSITVIVVSVIFVIATIWIVFRFFLFLLFITGCSCLFFLVRRRLCMLWILFGWASLWRFWLGFFLVFNLDLNYFCFEWGLDLISRLSRVYFFIWMFRFFITFYSLSCLLLSSRWYRCRLLLLFDLWLYFWLNFYYFSFFLLFGLWLSLLFILLNMYLFFYC